MELNRKILLEMSHRIEGILQQSGLPAQIFEIKPSSNCVSFTLELPLSVFAPVLGNTWFDDIQRSEPKVEVEREGKTYDVSFKLEIVEEKI